MARRSTRGGAATRRGPGARGAAAFEAALAALADADAAADPEAVAELRAEVFDRALALLASEGGVRVLYRLAERFSPAGVFEGSDWSQPARLQATLARQSMHDAPHTFALEALSLLRLLAIARDGEDRDGMEPHEARVHLEQVLAWNLDLVFPRHSEADRARALPVDAGCVQRLLAFLLEHLDSAELLHVLIGEAQRVLDQRPIRVDDVKRMIELAGSRLAPQGEAEAPARVRRLLRALRGPTALAAGAADLDAYAELLEGLDAGALRAEAAELGRHMHELGLVSPHHAVLLRRAAALDDVAALAAALVLDDVGRGCLQRHGALVRRLIERVIRPPTAQAVYGLACTLNRGVLTSVPVAPALRAMLRLRLDPAMRELLAAAAPSDSDLEPEELLLGGVLSVLGQPLGVGQGDNPTCQAARAISLWSQCTPGYLLGLIAGAAAYGEVEMVFEGVPIRSSQLEPGLLEILHTDLDPVSLILVPLLDRIYAEMGRMVDDRDEDGHRWINPEFHGWWVHRDVATPLDQWTGALADLDGFLRLFYAAYHPAYNGGREPVHPQPAGIASTDIHGGLVGWHAVSIQRIDCDPAGALRVYFYDPNNDGNQDWGHGVVTSTAGRGEVPGECSLPFDQLAARVYLFHYDRRLLGDPGAVPDGVLAPVLDAVHQSWGCTLLPQA